MVQVDNAVWKETARRVLELMRTEGNAAAFGYLDSLGAAKLEGGEPVAGPPEGFREVAGILYWEHKALPEFVAISQEVLRRLEIALEESTNPADENLVRPLGGTHYNLASFAWPGWDEPGIVITGAELEAGRRSAAKCLEIRQNPLYKDVQFGYSPATAQWVVGAYALADGNWQNAREHFMIAQQLNREAGEDDSLEAAYVHLAGTLEGDTESKAIFERTIADLEARAGNEDADFLRTQLLTAQRVFTER